MQLVAYIEGDAMNDLSDQFRIARENKKVSLEDVSQELKISQYYLEAIESSNLQLLPESVYAIGFIKNYAKFLRIDHTAMLECFKKSQIAQKKDIDTEKQSEIESRDFTFPFSNISKINILLCTIYIAIIIIAIVFIS